MSRNRSLSLDEFCRFSLYERWVLVEAVRRQQEQMFGEGGGDPVIDFIDEA